MVSIDEEQDDFVAEFNAIGDWLLQYDLLLALYASLPMLPEERCTEESLIRGCASRLWLTCRMEEGVVRLMLASDALIVGAVAGIIVRLLDGRTPKEILTADINFIRRTALREELSADRLHGMDRVIETIRSFARIHIP